MQQNLLQLFVTSCSVRVFKLPTDQISLAVMRQSRGAQLSGSRSPLRINILRWHLTFVGPQYGTCFMLPFWRLEIFRLLLAFLKICARLCRVYTVVHLKCDRSCFCASHKHIYWIEHVTPLLLTLSTVWAKQQSASRPGHLSQLIAQVMAPHTNITWTTGCFRTK